MDFPLKLGNEWQYRSQQKNKLTIKVTEEIKITDNQSIYKLEYFPFSEDEPERWLLKENGDIYELNIFIEGKTAQINSKNIIYTKNTSEPWTLYEQPALDSWLVSDIYESINEEKNFLTCGYFRLNKKKSQLRVENWTWDVISIFADNEFEYEEEESDENDIEPIPFMRSSYLGKTDLNINNKEYECLHFEESILDWEDENNITDKGNYWIDEKIGFIKWIFDLKEYTIESYKLN